MRKAWRKVRSTRAWSVAESSPGSCFARKINFSKTQNLQKQVQNLLSETQHNLRAHRDTVCLRQKQSRVTEQERKGLGIFPEEEEYSKEVVKSFT